MKIFKGLPKNKFTTFYFSYIKFFNLICEQIFLIISLLL